MEQLLEGASINMYFGATQVLKSVDFHVMQNEIVGVVGPNGAGKTTLFNILAGLLSPSSGTVRFAGADVTGTDAAYRSRAGIGRTFQIPRPFLGMTVLENAIVAAQFGAGLQGITAAHAATKALSIAGLLAFANRPAATLGLLDRKRLELARTLATRPKVILLDEIGGGLTEAELHLLVKLILQLRNDGVTIVWIEHILHALMKVVDRLVCMSEGVIIAAGKPQEVIADKAVVRAYLGGSIE
jgi:branched-chain amino acid transport system ATP-binding protein